MKDLKGFRTGLLALISFIPCIYPQSASSAVFDIEMLQRPEEIVLKHEGKPVLKYMSGRSQYKPYVSELYTTTGFNVLRDAPFDHHHHHGLMYGIKVNGVNFWEEISGSGVQKVITTACETQKNQDSSAAIITQELHWLAAQDAFLPESRVVPLLIEHRTLTFTIDPTTNETCLIWKARFEVPGKTNTVSLTGSSYHGLGARFLAALDPVSRHVSASGIPDLSGTKQDVSKHPWEAVVFDSPDCKATMAVFGSPDNARGEPLFFGMERPFTYIAATQGLDKEPLIYKSGDRFEIKYLVLLYPEAKSQDWLSERWKKFEAGK